MMIYYKSRSKAREASKRTKRPVVDNGTKSAKRWAIDFKK